MSATKSKYLSMQVVAAGANPIQITRGIDKTVAALVKELKLLSKEVRWFLCVVFPFVKFAILFVLSMMTSYFDLQVLKTQKRRASCCILTGEGGCIRLRIVNCRMLQL